MHQVSITTLTPLSERIALQIADGNIVTVDRHDEALGAKAAYDALPSEQRKGVCALIKIAPKQWLLSLVDP